MAIFIIKKINQLQIGYEYQAMSIFISTIILWRTLQMKNLLPLIDHVWKSHTHHALEPQKRCRKWDGQTPYAIHPIWCAMTILTETSLPEELRARGAEALLQHDVKEDTSQSLHFDTSREIESLVGNMTFDSFEQEVSMTGSMTPEVKLLKLYDKVSNLLDGTWMSPEKRKGYLEYTMRLATDVEKVYGKDLNILKIARALA